MDRELVVIGGGPAGITLAKRLGRRMDMAVVRPEPHSMIYCAMPYAIEGLLPIEKTFKKDELVTGSGAALVRDRAVRLDLEHRRVYLAGGPELGFRHLVLATGARPFIPPIPGADLPGVMGFKTQEDMERIMAACAAGLRRAVVVGAGSIGVELAQALAARGVRVSLVDQKPSILPNLVDPDMVRDAEAALDAHGVELVLGASVTALEGKRQVQRVVLEDGRRLELAENDGPSPLVVFAVGVVPEVSLVEGTEVEIGRTGIRVDDRMRTSVPGVYACGDCAEFVSGITGKVVPGKLATNAVPMAKVLADNLLGRERRYPGFYNGAATKVYGFFIGGTGLTSAVAEREGMGVVTGEAELTTRFPIMPDARPVRVRLLFSADSGRLIGGQVISGEPVTAQVDLLTWMIQQGNTVDEVVDLSYSAQPYQSFFPAANAVVAAAEKAREKLSPLPASEGLMSARR